jgi:hypothetical protein
LSLLEHIINSNKKIINIVGVPGAGKTKLIEDIARHSPRNTFLYLSFGRENTKNARRRMPKNVTCSSFHAQAKKSLSLNPSRIIKKLTLGEANQALKAIGLAAKEAKTLESFVILNSLFCMSGFPLKKIHQLIKMKQHIFPAMTPEEMGHLSMAYCKYWAALWVTDKNIGLPVTHDMYFKAYATCASALQYDFLIVDEMQDLNDAMYSCIDRVSRISPETRTIKLGDPCQQIYSFRGASNQFSSENFDYSLVQSHRFGKQLCNITNEFMGAQNIPYYTNIESAKDSTRILAPGSISDLISSIAGGSRPTVISRYNITLWHMVKNMAMGGVMSAINGSNESELDFLQSLYRLSEGEYVNTPELKGISYKRYHQMARVNHDNAGILACRFVESMKGNGASVFKMIREHLTTPKKAHVLFTTVHQAKGLEFNDVIMTDDFPECRSESGDKFLQVTKDEANIIYTAMTRAKESITLPRSWQRKAQ